jgi:topoisomerase-4 subunit B
MYIGRTGSGAHYDDGIYILVKEVIDNGIDEFIMGHGDRIDVTIEDDMVTIRDFGRGIPLGKVVDCVSTPGWFSNWLSSVPSREYCMFSCMVAL